MSQGAIYDLAVLGQIQFCPCSTISILISN